MELNDIITGLVLIFALIGFVLTIAFICAVIIGGGPARNCPIHKESNSVWVDMHSQGESEDDDNA